MAFETVFSEKFRRCAAIKSESCLSTRVQEDSRLLSSLIRVMFLDIVPGTDTY